MKNQSKWIAKSKTLWGAIIMAVPVVAPVVGIDLSPEATQEVADAGVSVIEAAFAVIGGALVIIGRLTAAATATVLPPPQPKKEE